MKSPKNIIDENKQKIDLLIKKSPVFFRTQYMNWFKAQVSRENYCLFPHLDRKAVVSTKIDFKYMANQREVLNYITNIKNISMNIGLEQIKLVHEMLCNDPDSKIFGGLFRTANVRLQNMEISSPDYTVIPYKINKVLNYLADPGIHVIDKAICAHVDIIKIQPFRDYNKRTARIIMNWILLQNGYRPIIFDRSEDGKKYLNAINNTMSHYDLYRLFMMQSMIRTQTDIISLLQNNYA